MEWVGGMDKLFIDWEDFFSSFLVNGIFESGR